jgi:hypothetical protein
MRKVGMMLAFVSLVLLSVNVQASNLCDIEQLPSYVSANSSMLMVIPRSTVQAKMGNLTHPMKIIWVLRNVDFAFLDEGSFIKFNDCWVCEFSGKVSNFYGNCGPTPLRESGQFRLYFTAKDFTKSVEFNRTVLVHEEGLAAGVSVDDNGDVHITVDAPTDTREVWMTLYDADDGSLVQDFNKTELTESDLRPARYFMDITSLGMGSYYASFGFRTTTERTGGGLSKFEIKSKEVELTVQTDSDSYWLGEEVIISGQTKYEQVSGSVRFPSGRSESLSSKSAQNQQFSFSFKLLSSYEEGDYVVTVNAGGASAQHTFSVEKVLHVSPTTLTFIVTNTTDMLEKSVTIQNMGNSTVSLSASTEGVTSYVTTFFDRTSLSPGSTSTLTVRLNPANLVSSVTGRVLITGNSIVTFPIDIAINLGITSQDGARIEVSPGYWQTEDCMVGEALTPSFTVQNVGSGELSGFGHSLSGDLDGITDVTLPASSLSSGSFGSVELEITPERERTSGWIRITSNGGHDTIYINLDCVPDLSYDISLMQSNVEDLKSQFYDAGFDEDAISSVFYTLDAELSDSLTDLNSGEYASSKASYISAMSRYDTLGMLVGELGSVAPPGDSSWVTWVVVIVVLVVLAFLGFFLYNKFGSKFVGGKSEEDEAYEEELY